MIATSFGLISMLRFSAWKGKAGVIPLRVSSAIHIEAGLCSQTMCSVRTCSKPDRASSAFTPRGVRCTRWRGASQCSHPGPAIRACQEAALGTPTSTRPPGRSQPRTRRSAAPGSSRCSSTCHSTTASRPSAECSSIAWRSTGRPARSAIAALLGDGSIPWASWPRRRSSSTSRPVPAPASSTRAPRRHARAAQRPRGLAHREALKRPHRAAGARRARAVDALLVGGGPGWLAARHRRAAGRAASERVEPPVRRLARRHLDPLAERPAAGGAAQLSRVRHQASVSRTVSARGMRGRHPVAAAKRS